MDFLKSRADSASASGYKDTALPQQMQDIEKQLDQLIQEINQDRSRVAAGQSDAARAEAETLQALEQAERMVAEAAKLAEQTTVAAAVAASADGAAGVSGASGAAHTPSLEDQLNELIAEAQANEALRQAAAAKEAAQSASSEPEEENKQSILEGSILDGSMETVEELIGASAQEAAPPPARPHAAGPTPPPPPIAAPSPPGAPPHEDDSEIPGNMDSIEAILGEDADVGAINTITPVALAGQGTGWGAGLQARSPQGEMVGLDDLTEAKPSSPAAAKVAPPPPQPAPAAAPEAEPLGLEDQLNKLLAESGQLTAPSAASSGETAAAPAPAAGAAPTVEQIDAELAGQFASVDDLDSEMESAPQAQATVNQAALSAPAAPPVPSDAVAGLEEQLQKMMDGVEPAAAASVPAAGVSSFAGQPAASGGPAQVSQVSAAAPTATAAIPTDPQTMTGGQRVAAEMDADGTMDLPAGDMEAFDFEEPPAEDAATQPKAAEAAAAPAPSRPRRKPGEHLATFGKIGYKTLVVINAPLTGLSDSARGIIGYVGVGTLVVALSTIAYVLFIRS